jgi:hypothetical protein
MHTQHAGSGDCELSGPYIEGVVSTHTYVDFKINMSIEKSDTIAVTTYVAWTLCAFVCFGSSRGPCRRRTMPYEPLRVGRQTGRRADASHRARARGVAKEEQSA